MSERLMANVLCRGCLTVASEAVLYRLKEKFGVAALVLTPKLDNKNGFILDVDGAHVVVVFEGRAMPLAELEALHGEKRDADGPLLRHNSTAMLTCLNVPQDHAGKMRMALRLVQAITCIVDEPGVSAVLWSFSQALVPAEQFQRLTAQWTAMPEEVPLLLIARMAVYKDGAEDGVDRYGMFGFGFRPFLGRDIEFMPGSHTPEAVINSFELVTRWAMLKGLVFRDGDTCGASQTERIRIRYRDAGRVVQGPVLMCDIEHLDHEAERPVA